MGPPSRALVHTVVNIYSRIWANILSHGTRTAVALSGHMVYDLEGHGSGLCQSHEEGAQYSAVSESGEFGMLVPTLDSISRTVDQSVTSGCFGNCGRYYVVQSHWSATVPPLSGC